jgi:FAD binding domain-containing protein/berberine-like enzyme
MNASPFEDLKGAVIRPDDRGYDEARAIYNGLYQARPALVVRPADAGEVVRAIAVAEREGYEVAVKGGGHSIAGYGTTDGGLLIDLSDLREIHVDVAARAAVVGGGVRAGALAAALNSHGLAVPLGDSPHVGVAGLTLGGGIGWLSRKLGLMLDSLSGVEIVLADGRIVTASKEDHADLFWALRGGGGNFGVVTQLRFRPHLLGQVIGGALALPASPIVLRRFLDLAAEAPDELGTIALVTRLPAIPQLPSRAHDRLAVFVTLVWCGEHAEGERYIDRLRNIATPLIDNVRAAAYPDIYSLVLDGPPSITNLTSTLLADDPADLDDNAIDAILQAVDRPNSQEPALFAIELRVLGGAILRVSPEATAFAHRQRRLVCSMVTAGFDPSHADRHRSWVEGIARQLAHLSKGAYVNFIGMSQDAHLHDAYPLATLRRLEKIKAVYDPANVFHRNLNIQPSTRL